MIVQANFMLFKLFILGLAFSVILGCLPASPKKVTLVEVDKSARKLFLKQHGKVIKSYDVALGSNPVGHKIHEGDNKTPEGVYVLDYKNHNSKFYRSIHVSYPNFIDNLRAKSFGVKPGGAIVIHGLPDGVSQEEIVKLRGRDWTNGCIALNNSDMQEVWSLVQTNTPIHIKP